MTSDRQHKEIGDCEPSKALPTAHPNGKPVIAELQRPMRFNDELLFENDDSMPDTVFGKVLKGLLIEFLSKQEHRIGWARKSACDDISLMPHPNESVAAHMWGVGRIIEVLTCLEEFAEDHKEFDFAKAKMMASMHDVPELITGDITPVDGISELEKHRRERKAMEKIFSYYPSSIRDQFRQVYNDYESRQCAESKFVKDCDKLDFIIYALLLERQGFSGFEEFYTNSVKNPFFTKTAKNLADTVIEYREELKKRNLLYKKS